MSNIYTSQSQAAKPNQGQVLSDLTNLEKELMARRSSVTEIGEITMIEEALTQVKAAQQATVEQVTESRITAGLERDQTKSSIPSVALNRGEQFKSYSGHGTSYIDYMKTNIAGLAQLISKN